jgi:DNA-directed RNA polymerase II subunit RPB4
MAGLTPLAQTARRRPKPAGDEEASSVLKLGEMSNSAALSTAAAHELLLKIEEARQKDPKLPLITNDLIIKNNTYLRVFARHKGSDTVQQVTSEAETLTQLAEFERAQLGEFVLFDSFSGSCFECLRAFLLVDGWLAGWTSPARHDSTAARRRDDQTENLELTHAKPQARSAATQPKKRAR